MTARKTATGRRPPRWLKREWDARLAADGLTVNAGTPKTPRRQPARRHTTHRGNPAD